MTLALESIVQERKDAAAKAALDALNELQKARHAYRQAVHHEGAPSEQSTRALAAAVDRLGLKDDELEGDLRNLEAYRQHQKRLLGENESRALRLQVNTAKQQAAEEYRKIAASFFANGDPELMHSLFPYFIAGVNWLPVQERAAIESRLNEAMDHYRAAERPLHVREHEHNAAQQAIENLARQNPRLFGND